MPESRLAPQAARPGETFWQVAQRFPDLSPLPRCHWAEDFELGGRRVQSQRQDRRQVGPPLSARRPQWSPGPVCANASRL